MISRTHLKTGVPRGAPAVLGALLLFAGCSKPPPDLRPELERRDQRIAALKAELAAVHAQDRAQADAVAEKARKQTLRLQAEIEDLNNRLALKEQTLEKLRKQLTQRKQKELTPPAPPQFGSVRIKAMAPSSRDTNFPLRVYALRRSTVKTTAHLRPHAVKTDETYRDAYGQKKKKVKWEYEPVSQYDERLVFSVDNPSERELHPVFRAGRTAQTIVFEPGATGRVVSVGAARGSDLWVILDGQTKRFEVPEP